MQLRQRRPRCIGDSLHDRPHAGAGIEQQNNIQRLFLPPQMHNGHRAPVVGDKEVLLRQPINEPLFLPDFHVHVN